MYPYLPSFLTTAIPSLNGCALSKENGITTFLSLSTYPYNSYLAYTFFASANPFSYSDKITTGAFFSFIVILSPLSGLLLYHINLICQKKCKTLFYTFIICIYHFLRFVSYIRFFTHIKFIFYIY